MLVVKTLAVLLTLRTFSLGELQIAFWTDAVQTNIDEDVADSLKELSGLNIDSGIEIQHAVMVVETYDSKSAENMHNFCQLLSSTGISVVLDFTYHRWLEGLDYIKSHRIPYIRVDRMLSPFMRIFGEFLRQKNANEVAMILQNEQDNIEALFGMIERFPFRALLLNAAGDVDFVKRLQDLRPLPSYYGILARGSNMNSIFEEIKKGKLFVRPKEWHFVFLEPGDRVFKYRQEVEFSTKFTINSKVLCKSLNMREDYCSTRFTFQRAIILQILRSLIDIKRTQPNELDPLRWECNGTSPIQDHTDITLLEHLKSNGFMIVNVDNSYDGYYIPTLTYDLNVSISLYSNEHDVVTDLAVWQSGKLHKVNETISPAKRFFRIGTTEAIPWSYHRRNSLTGSIEIDSNGKPVWEGFCIDFIEVLSAKLNFDYELVEPTKGKFGKRDPHTGRWDGLVGDLVSGETDFVVSALKMYSEREEVIDYIAPYFDQTGISIVMRKPVRHTSLFKFMTVLRVEVWMSILGALMATAILIWIVDKYSPYSARNNKIMYPYPCREFSLRECFWFALTSFTPQGGGEAPKSVSGRLLVAAYWLFVVLMLATFTANLAAFLTVERMQTPVQSLEQLARQARINYTVVDGSDTHQYFINMKFAEDTLYRMWKELVLNVTTDYHKYRIWDYPIREQYGQILLSINASNPVRDAAAGFRKVSEHEDADFAFIHDSSEIKYEVTRNCNLTEVGEVFGEQPYAVAVQQGSHLQDELSYAILELQKDRYFEELKAKHWNYTRIKGCSQSEGHGGITLESLGGVFIATLFGLGLSMVILALEVFYYRHNRPSSDDIIQVKPVTESKPRKALIGAWHSGKSHITPPPTFEAATFRGKRVPPNITLGGEEFKPRRIGLRSRREMGTGLGPSLTRSDDMPSNGTTLPSFVE